MTQYRAESRRRRLPPGVGNCEGGKMDERIKERRKCGNPLAFPQRQESWKSDQTWGWLTPWERNRVRTHGLQLNVMKPNWRPPRND